MFRAFAALVVVSAAILRADTEPATGNRAGEITSNENNKITVKSYMDDKTYTYNTNDNTNYRRFNGEKGTSQDFRNKAMVLISYEKQDAKSVQEVRKIQGKITKADDNGFTLKTGDTEKEFKVSKNTTLLTNSRGERNKLADFVNKSMTCYYYQQDNDNICPAICQEIRREDR